jgi:nitrite reductase/ring-hydroxylating ferredoxin subunit
VTELRAVGTYSRDFRASLDRLIENALDWEHLPHVHDGSFSSIALIEHGSRGWRADARLADGSSIILDLRLDGDGWITRSFSGDRLLSEIRSKAEATGPDSCRVEVRFLVSGVAPAKAQQIGAWYKNLYARLYDEDERLMIARADALRRGPAALKERRAVRLADGSILQAPLYCPHQGLPLDGEPDAEGTITCPWHGYRVDIRTGRATPPCIAAPSEPPACFLERHAQVGLLDEMIVAKTVDVEASG